MGMNYCPFCGSQLVENAKFCSQCGKPVPDTNKDEGIETEQQIETANDLESKEMRSEPELLHTIKIGEYDLQVAESVIAYNKVRSHFVDYAEKSQRAFESLYDKEVHDFEGLYSKALPAFLDRAADAIQFAVSVLGQYGLTIESNEFLLSAQDGLHFDTYLKDYIDLAEQLEDFTEQLSNCRANNRSRNIQWQGGGFGLKGAIGGAMMAGVLNIATDAVRGIGHSIVDSADRARLKKLQIDLYNASNHKEFLSSKLRSFCIDLFGPAVNLLEDHGLIVHPPFDIAAGIGPITEAFDLVDNSYVRKEDYEKALEMTLSGMPYDPYFPLSYLTLYKIPFIKNSDVLEVVRFFGVEDRFAAKVTEYEEDQLESFKAIPEDTVEAIDKKLLKAKELNSEFCYIHISLEELANKREKIIRKAEEDAARRAAELKKQKENYELFLKIKELPETDLEQLHTKHDQLVELTTTPEITKEIDRIAEKIEQYTEQERKTKEWSDFIAAFSDADLDTGYIAKKLVNSSTFQALYSKLNWDLDQTKKLLKQAYFKNDSEYHIVLRDDETNYLTMLQRIRFNFAQYSQTEIPIIFIRDHDTYSSGMLITNQKLYIKGDSENDRPYAIPLNNVRAISATKRSITSTCVAWKISVNKTPGFEMFEHEFLERFGIEKLIEIIYFIKDYCLFLASKDKDHTDSFFLDVLNAAGISQEDFESKFNFSSQSDIEKIKQEVKAAESLIVSNNEQELLEKIKQKNVCYCYTLEHYYYNLVTDADPDDGKDHLDQVKRVIQRISEKKNIHPFYEYLEAYLWIHYYELNRENDSRYVTQVCKFADQGLSAAMAMKGFWATQGYKNLRNMVEEGMSLLKRASALDEPTAMAWLGSYYRTGSFGLQVDLAKAKELLTRAAAYGQPYAIKELKALDEEGVGAPHVNKTESSSSGCFITTAVCRTLKKPDNCYELTAFRSFRDKWLYKQPGGKELIEEYYRIAPPIVGIIDSLPDSASIYQSIWKKYLTPCLQYIESGQFEKCKTSYITMVNTLKTQYNK